MIKHTPGPWGVNGTPGEGNLLIMTSVKRKDEYGRLRNTAVALILNQGDETEANANLIAAAPEMYEMLKAIITANNENDGDILNELVEAENVIAKVEGR